MGKRRAFLQMGGAYGDGQDESQWGGITTRRQQRAAAPASARGADYDPGEGTSGFSGFEPLTPPATPTAPSSRAVASARRATRRRGPSSRPAGTSNAEWMDRIRPLASSLMSSGEGIYGMNRSINSMLTRTKITRARGRTIPHSHVSGWLLHGKKKIPR